mgnify:CR=1 FL=1
MRRLASDIRVLLAAYAVLLVAAALSLPLQLEEVLRLVGATQHSFADVTKWSAQIPGAAPAGDYVQFVLLGALGRSLLACRIFSIACGLAAGYFMLQLARQALVQQPLLATGVFLLLPLQCRYAVNAQPDELALLFLLLSTICYFRLIYEPSATAALLYGAFLLGGLYTAPFSYLPAIGYLLFLLLFIVQKHVRRAFWHALPATVLPLLIYVPYLVWARHQRADGWLYGGDSAAYAANMYQKLWQAVSGGPGVTGYLLSSLLLIAAAVACWRSFRLSEAATSKRIALFCLFGGFLSTIVIVLLIDSLTGAVFTLDQLLWLTPAAAVLTTAAFDWLQQQQRSMAWALALLILLLSVYGDVRHFSSKSTTIAAVSATAKQQISGDACIVFVSEALSKAILTFSEPDLDHHECLDFFHRKIILASHPYVREDQQRDAESYFKGLNFLEKKRITVGCGQVIVIEQSAGQ